MTALSAGAQDGRSSGSPFETPPAAAPSGDPRRSSARTNPEHQLDRLRVAVGDAVGEPAQAELALGEPLASAVGRGIGDRLGERLEQNGDKALVAGFAAAAGGDIALLETGREWRAVAADRVTYGVTCGFTHSGSLVKKHLNVTLTISI
jgi:hypothetical protein